MAKEMAVGFLRQAERRQKSAKIALEESDFAYVVRQCQEGVEFALKAALIYAGIDFPKWHDVGPILIREKDSLKFWNDEVIQKFASYSRRLSNDRARSITETKICFLLPKTYFSDTMLKKPWLIWKKF